MPSTERVCPTCGRAVQHDGKRWFAPYWCSWCKRRLYRYEVVERKVRK